MVITSQPLLEELAEVLTRQLLALQRRERELSAVRQALGRPSRPVRIWNVQP